MPVNSATLPVPATLEATVRNGQTNDFAALTQAFYRTYGAIPSASDADPAARNLIDAANVQSQAMMQKLLAAMIRQEAARVAHGNSRRKRDSALVAKASQGIC